MPLTWFSSRRRQARAAVIALCTIAATTATCAAGAAEPLVWKFEPGARHRYRFTQSMEMAYDLGPAGTQEQALTNVVDLSWTVAEVAADGSGMLKLNIDRIQTSLTMPETAPVEYDTASTDEPEGFAAMLAPPLGAMVRAEFTVTMTPRGKIAEVVFPESLAASLKVAPVMESLGDLATPEGFKRMLSGLAFELPEALEPGVEWSTTAASGAQTVKTTYRYVGPREHDGVSYEAIALTVEVANLDGAASPEISNQNSSGEVLFNRTAGRLESTTLDYAMAMKATSTLEHHVEVKWLPEDAK